MTGVVLTKMDGDARGGAALSVVSVVGVPIAFAGSGERLEDLEAFHADRVVSRILGMGDVLTLIEKAERVIDEEQAVALERKIREDDFTLDDFRDQLRAIKKMGPLESILGMIPGMGNLKQAMPEGVDERKLLQVEAIISSMTPFERRRHDLINGSRRKRIARGSGTSVEDVNRLLKQFVQMRKMLKAMGGAMGGGGKGGEDVQAHEQAAFVHALRGVRPHGARPTGRAWASGLGAALRAARRQRKVEKGMLVIRMRRMGAKKNPFYRVVVTEAARGARERLRREPRGVQPDARSPRRSTLDRERYAYWVGKGAQPSDTVRTARASGTRPTRPPAAAAEQPAS